MSNKKVLVVDDMPDVRLEVRRLLEPLFEVTLASSGQEAFELCGEQGPFAAILTDQGMPGMTGTEVLAQMRADFPDTVRIMMSGYADLELAIDALKAGALFRFMQKPFRPEFLIETVQAGVERFQLIEQERFLTKQLEFSRTSLLSLTETLELRLADQLGRMRGLQRYCLALSKTSSLLSVAELTAQVCGKLLGSRAIEVNLMDDLAGTKWDANFGGNLDGPLEQVLITSREAELGVIRLALGKAGQLNECEHELLTSIASTAATCAHYHLTRRSRDLAQDATIFALSSLAQKRDDNTGKHLRRISMYSELIAKSLRSAGLHEDELSDAFIKQLVASVPLHDIGKVGIPDSILMKPGPLSDAEWKVMRTHSDIGAQALCRLFEASGENNFLRMGHEIAWAHHERWDGSGYPRGLQGAETPLCARIAGVADCYDALTSWRIYKDAWTHQEAMSYILENSGIQFDPDIVAAVQMCAHSLDHIRESLADSEIEVRAKRVA